MFLADQKMCSPHRPPSKKSFLSHLYALSNLAWDGNFGFACGVSFVFKKLIFISSFSLAKNKTVIVIIAGTNNENPEKD